MLKITPSGFITAIFMVVFCASSFGQPMPCAGLAVNGDYSYEVYTENGKVFFKLIPLAPINGSSAGIVYIREGTSGGVYSGYTMALTGKDLTYSKAFANGTVLSFYFSYKVPAGGERNSKDDPHDYLVGTSCLKGAPAVSITTPIAGTDFISPATVSINATASDVDGTVSKVEFYQGNTLLGVDDTKPYTFLWNNVPAATYDLTAKAIDNTNLSTSSVPVKIIVSPPNLNGFCGTAFNKDYEFKADTIEGKVIFTLHALSPIVGSKYALINIKEGVADTYSGYDMIPSGADFIFLKTIAVGTPLRYYFTYNVPTGGERNSSANPHSYVVGKSCTGANGIPSVSITGPNKNAIFTEPALVNLQAAAFDADGTVANVEFFRGNMSIGKDLTGPYGFDWTNVPAGNYQVTAKVTDDKKLTNISTDLKVTVNINFGSGYCGTVANGDYSYKVETIGGNVVFSMHPLTPIKGSAYALIYVREGLTGAYPGYPMTAIGPDFRFTKAIADKTPLSIYFTYSVPTGGERNSSLTPHPYVVGSDCIVPVGNKELDRGEAWTIYPNPVGDQLCIQGAQIDLSEYVISISNQAGQKILILQERTGIKKIDVSAFLPGLYFLEMTNLQTGNRQSKQFVKL